MNILWLRPDKPGDISVGRHRIASELIERGHEVEVRNTTVADFKSVLDDSPDVVVGTTRLGAFVGTWKKLAAGTPLVVDHIDPISQLRRTHGPVTTWGVSQFEKLSFRLADHVMVVYEEELSRVEKYTSDVTKTSLGVDFDLFSDPPSETIRAANEVISSRVPEDEHVLIYVGGLEPPYHLPTIIEAISLLDDWHFVVLGDGSQREWLEERAQNRPDVHYLETVPYEDVPGFLHVADVGISLVDDPNSLKVLEYGAAKLPVVHSQGTAEDRYDGQVKFCRINPESVSNAIERAIRELDSDRLCDQAENHSWIRITDQYERVLASIL